MPKQSYLECAKIINTHGVVGVMRLESFCDSTTILASLPRVFLKNGESYLEKKVIHASRQKQFVLMSLEGITDINEAALLKGRILYAKREDLPLPGNSYFIADLIDLPVIDADTGKQYGKIANVSNYGAGDIYEVQTTNGIKLVPAVPSFIKKIDIDIGIFITPIEGLLN